MLVLRARTIASALAVLLATTTAAHALEPAFVPTEEDVKAEEAERDGWDGLLEIGANMAFGSNKDVVGKQNGETWTFGLTLDSGLRLSRNKHDWRNTLSIQETFSRTPVIDEFVKTADTLDVQSIYYFLAKPWIGPFALVALDAPLLPGYDYRPEPRHYDLIDGDRLKTDSENLRLTDSFQVLTLKQSVGAFVRPVREDTIEVEARAGFGAREVFADGALAVNDDDATPDTIEVLALDSYAQGGAELAASLVGSLNEGKVTYKAWGEALFPFIHDAEGDRSVAELTNAEFGASLSFQLVEWASLNYQFKAVRQPQLIDEWQIQNNLLLSVGYTFID
ncbi:MAG: hypothetical protein ACQEXJ_05930 [Myxococcota bacterium]